MLNIYDVDTARRTILRRQPPGMQELPSALLKTLARIFGQGVSPSQAVAQILAAVQQEGDAALSRWRPDPGRRPIGGHPPTPHISCGSF